MKYKALVTHAVLDDDKKPSVAYVVRAYIDEVESDKDISDNKPPFYYQVGDVATPSISCSANKVTITAAGADAIYYTTDGTAPDTTKTKYTGPFTISSTVTVKAIAYHGELYSDVKSQQCTYVAPPATPTISCENNTVTIASSGSTAIYYTTDSSNPDTTKTKYTASFAISSTVTVKAIAYNSGVASAVASQECTYVAPENEEAI